jgi:hypothetical protein
VYSYLKTFIFGYFYVNRAGENLLARCIPLIKISFSFLSFMYWLLLQAVCAFFLIYVTQPILLARA